MNDRTLVKLRCNKEILDIRTVSWTRKSPRSFSILRSELQQLEQRPRFLCRSAADAGTG